MSLCAPDSYWKNLELHASMNKYSFADLMDLDKARIERLIELSNKVLDNHEKAVGLLDGKISDEFKTSVECYIEVLSLVKDMPRNFIPDVKNGFGNMPKYVWKEEKIRNDKLESGEIKKIKVRGPNDDYHFEVGIDRLEDFKPDKEFEKSIFGWWSTMYVEVLKEKRGDKYINPLEDVE